MDPTPAPTPAPAGVSPTTPAPTVAPIPPTTPPAMIFPPTSPPTIPPTMPPSPLPPTSYTDLGCYGDDPQDRVLTGFFVIRDTTMTTQVRLLLRMIDAMTGAK